MNYLNTLVTKTLQFFGAIDPHGFSQNYKFIGYTDKQTHLPWRNEKVRHDYQFVVRQHLKRNLLGVDFDHIMNQFHHPIATIDKIVSTLRDKGDLSPHVIPKDRHYHRGIQATIDAFRPPHLIRPVHFADLRYYQWNWHPNVEEPFYSDKALRAHVNESHSLGFLPDGRMSFGNLKNVVFIRTRRFLHHIKRGDITNLRHLYPPMKLHFKPALTSIDDYKVRIVFGVSKLHILPCAMFFWPLFRYYIDEHSSPLLWGYETILGGMLKLHLLMSIPNLYYRTFVTIDWSGFDFHTIHDMIRDLLSGTRTFFDFNNGYIPTKYYKSSQANPIHLERLWNWIVEAIFKMPFILPDKTMYTWKHRGFASGLFPTQYIDSIYNLAMIYTILDSMGFDISKLQILVQGDDSISMLTFHIPANEHSAFQHEFGKLAKYYFDSVARPEKTHISNDPQSVEVLGYSNWNGYPCRDWRKLLAQLYHPRGSPDMSILAARCCGIQYASMYNYPEVTRTCRDVFNHVVSAGITPAALPIQRDVILQGETSFHVDTSHFPTEAEVTRHLRSPYVRTADDKDEYFPMSHFVTQF
nr:MAG: putative RNA-dependent RNA polymerase [Alphapartitivirus sp.]